MRQKFPIQFQNFCQRPRTDMGPSVVLMEAKPPLIHQRRRLLQQFLLNSIKLLTVEVRIDRLVPRQEFIMDDTTHVPPYTEHKLAGVDVPLWGR